MKKGLKKTVGLVAGTCWLKGKVTGSGNNVTVTWSM